MCELTASENIEVRSSSNVILLGGQLEDTFVFVNIRGILALSMVGCSVWDQL